MNTFANPPLIVTVLVALGGWFAVHRLSAWRDRVNFNRGIRTEFLIKAFQKLANAAHRPPSPESQYFRDMEAAITDIQLFGSTSQIKMIDAFTHEFATKGSASMDELLNSLRSDLRKDLGYEPLAANVRWFRPEGSPAVAKSDASGTHAK
jgi:hypothetical protein